MPATRPYYRRRRPAPTLAFEQVRSDGTFVDFTHVPPPGFADPDAVATTAARFDDRAAALVAAAAGLGDVDAAGKPRLRPRKEVVTSKPFYEPYDLSEYKPEGGGVAHYLLLKKCLAVLAHADYFPTHPWNGWARSQVEAAVMGASPGWVGSYGPAVTGALTVMDQPDSGGEGNYDMNQMFILPIAYAYYDELSPAAREHLIRHLLAGGRIRRVNMPTRNTSGPIYGDWRRAGYISPGGAHKDLEETENHILMIHTVRYLANQLMFQRTRDQAYDNRRNGGDGIASCFELMLYLLHNILRGDFSEYNAKNYQEEVRQALVNLCSYAYDHEVRLAARMALDYVSARVAVSSSDLRRMVPFRRRNEDENVAHDGRGVMRVSLIAGKGADPMGAYLAVQSGNTRACVTRGSYGLDASRDDITLEVLGDYRLPPSVHDLFVSDGHRRFFQRLHRTPHPDEIEGHRNADNMEIQAGSPSYLITAGGQPAGYVIDPNFLGVNWKPSKVRQQLGVAVTTSFIPTTRLHGSSALLDRADQVIQFGAFSDTATTLGGRRIANYGVAPDFACGHQVHLPSWVGIAPGATGFQFADLGSVGTGAGRGPGCYLALYLQDGMAVLEAHDTWLHPGLAFEAFRAGVLARNAGLHLTPGAPATYRLTSGAVVQFAIWHTGPADFGAEVLSMTYGADPADAVGDAGNVTNKFLRGTVLTSLDAAEVVIRNPGLGTQLRLYLFDRYRPRRVDENGVVESAGSHEEVWADFEWTGPAEGDACRPYGTVATASSHVANHGTIRMIPSVSHERGPIGLTKRFRMVAPAGGVRIGVSP